MIRLNGIRATWNFDTITVEVPRYQQEEIFALLEEAAAKGGLVDVLVALPRTRRSRPSENLLYATARPWIVAMGYSNREGWMIAKLKFGVAHPWQKGFIRDRPGEFVEYDDGIWYVVSEADYTQDEASMMIDRLQEDAMHRGIDLGRPQ